MLLRHGYKMYSCYNENRIQHDVALMFLPGCSYEFIPVGEQQERRECAKGVEKKDEAGLPKVKKLISCDLSKVGYVPALPILSVRSPYSDLDILSPVNM